jgi:hypothetical protein
VRRKRALTRLARLFFHDHGGLAFEATSEVMTESDSGGNDFRQERPRFSLLPEQHFEKSRIVVEGNKIELAIKFAKIDRVQWEAHVVIWIPQ